MDQSQLGLPTTEAEPPPPPFEPPPRRPRVPLWGKLSIIAALVVLVIVVTGFVVHVPYSTIAPGDAVELTELVSVDGANTFPDNRGDIRLLFVRERTRVNLWRYIQARLDGDIDLFKEEELNPSGVSQEDLRVEATAQMTEAKIAATKVALEAAGYSVKPSDEGLVVLAAIPSRPAGKVLEEGDVILTADGNKIRNNQDLRAAISRHRDGEKVELGILRDGERKNVNVGVEVVDDRPSIGVLVVPRYDFPVSVDVDTAGIGGPSGGLAMTLAILDDLTPGNLTGGKRTAVTGRIDANGNVGEIGGIEQKAISARTAGAKLFLVPECGTPDPDLTGEDRAAADAQHAACEQDLARATERAGSGVKVIPVGTFEDALRVLRENGGDEPTPVGSAKAA
jgi:PDZ domain-containing protein